MSGTLTWRPVKSEGTLPYELKEAIDKRMQLSGSGFALVDEHDIKYFEGLVDASVKGAQEVIDLVKKYGSIELRVQY